MFNLWNWLFPPQCPLVAKDQEWLVRRLNWLAGQFGTEPLRSPPLTPENEFAPRAYDRSPAATRTLFSKICARMKVNERYVDLQIRESPREQRTEWDLLTGAFSTQSKHAPGTYQDSYDQKVQIDRALCDDFYGLIATMAHELSHVKLHRESEIQDGWEDYEKLTDLAAVFFGYGIFLAVTAERDFRPDADGLDVPTRTMGYVPTKVLCHALACQATLQGERHPRWRRYLDARSRRHLGKSMRYLNAAGRARLKLGRHGRLELETADPEDLEAQLKDAIAREDYEAAGRIKEDLKRRRQ